MDMLSTVLRRAFRASVVAAVLAVGWLAAPAQASPPVTWEEPDNGSTLHQLLILVGIPLAAVLLITLLVYLPSMIRGQQTQPAVAFQERSEWFGGPREGAVAADSAAAPEEDKGGAGARW